MNITRQELEAAGFHLAGRVSPDPAPLRCLNPRDARERWEGLFRVEISSNVEGHSVYIMVVNGEFKKAGHTGKGGSGFRARMRGSFNCLRPVIAAGPPYAGDPFKRHASVSMVEGEEVELWVKAQPTLGAMMAEEQELNERYRGQWTKEGHLVG